MFHFKKVLNGFCLFTLGVTALSSFLSFGGVSAVALAQEAPAIPEVRHGGPPAGVQQGPTAAEIAAFEQEQGASTGDFNAAPMERPTFEEPGTVPAEVRQLMPEKDLIKLYCAMSRWKMGTFFSAQEAVRAYVVPAVEAARAQGIDMAAPDVDKNIADGNKNLAAVCAAKTLDEAEKLVKDFVAWGQSQALEQMDQGRASMETQMKAKGDELRQKIKDQLQPFIEAETAKFEPEIRVQAEAIASSIIISAGGPGKEPPSEAAITAAVEAKLQPILQAKQAELEAKIKIKVQQVIGPEKAKFESIGKLFEGVQSKIDKYIKANEGKYAGYKAQALALRRDLILKMVDENLDAAIDQLQANKAKIDAAHAANPAVKGVDQLVAEINADRAQLKAKLQTTLAADDEYALQQAIETFRDKWEGVQQEAQTAATQGVTQMCSLATAQFKQAMAQLDPQLSQIQSLQSQCAGDMESADCLQVNSLAGRLGDISAKMNDLKTEMNLVTSMCAASQPDTQQISDLLTKIQSDGDMLNVQGDALNADKDQAIANSVQGACDQAMPQLDAARLQLKNDDLVVLASKIKTCAAANMAGKPECQGVADLTGKFNALTADVNSFTADMDKAQALCKKLSKDTDPNEVLAVLSPLQDKATALQDEAAALKAAQEEKTSAKTYCHAAEPQLNSAESDMFAGLEKVAEIVGNCRGLSNPRCDYINKNMMGEIAGVRAQVQTAYNNVRTIEAECGNAGIQPPTQSFLDKVTRALADKDAIAKAVTALEKKVDTAAAQGKGIWIEAESAIDYNTRTGVSNPMAREKNPSWRPPYYGDGDWYMGAGGDYLHYDFTVPAAGTYNMWVRDYVDKFQPRGVRGITIKIDNKLYGHTPENYGPAGGEKGAFNWHKVGSDLRLTAGHHTMDIIKMETSVGAAVLDAYYLTTGTETPPEK